jgi:hypothetical protein
MASTAAFSPFHQFIRLHVGNRQGIQGSPAEIVFSFSELIKLFFMTLGTGVLVRHPG